MYLENQNPVQPRGEENGAHNVVGIWTRGIIHTRAQFNSLVASSRQRFPHRACGRALCCSRSRCAGLFSDFNVKLLKKDVYSFRAGFSSSSIVTPGSLAVLLTRDPAPARGHCCCDGTAHPRNPFGQDEFENRENTSLWHQNTLDIKNYSLLDPYVSPTPNLHFMAFKLQSLLRANPCSNFLNVSYVNVTDLSDS